MDSQETQTGGGAYAAMEKPRGIRVIALTGRSGCGKSTVAAWYRQAGLPVLDADKVAADVVACDAACLAQLARAFGADILDEDGALRRRLLADRAFSSPDGQQKLTAITHPHIIRALLEKLKAQAAAGARLVFVDGAVIVGEPFEAYCDAILVVDAPDQLLVGRLCARDGLTPQQARRRLAAQPSRQRLLAAADAVLVNEGDLKDLHEQAMEVLRRWCQ